MSKKKTIKLFGVLLVISVFFPHLLPAAALTEINNIRIWSAPDRTRIVFDTSAPVKYEIHMLPNPSRAVIDFKTTTSKNLPLLTTKIEDKYIKRLRYAKRKQRDFRIVLDLKESVFYKGFALTPNKYYGHRVVVDLFSAHKKPPLKKTKPFAKKSLRDVVITVDPGHGGEDPGASGPKGTLEKEVVLNLSKMLVKLINKELGMRAALTREGDYYIGLKNRLKKAREKYHADLFVSIHADAFKDPKIRGSSVYVLSERPSSEAARWLAEQENSSDLIGGIDLGDKSNVLSSVLVDLSQAASLEASINAGQHVLNNLKKIGEVHNKKVQSANFIVLKAPDIPSILVETAFISNPQEEKKLRNKRYQLKIAKAIFFGIKEYFKNFAPPNSLLAVKTKKHVIKKGESLSTIAAHHQVAISQLKNFNKLKGNIIRTGQILNIPINGN